MFSHLIADIFDSLLQCVTFHADKDQVRRITGSLRCHNGKFIINFVNGYTSTLQPLLSLAGSDDAKTVSIGRRQPRCKKHAHGAKSDQ